jgi:hypothetical protein
MLHRTPAYQAAGFELLVAEANWIVRQIGSGERIAMQNPAPEEWSVANDHPRISGSVCSASYRFNFLQGVLRGITKIKWMERLSPPVRNWSDIAGRSSLIDVEGAEELARGWLRDWAISVEELEARHPLKVSQAKIRMEDDGAGRENRVAAPFFILHWGLPPSVPLSMQILGTTKELIGLEINDPSVWRRPRLELVDGAELLGEPPSPKEFVEQRLGKEVVEIIEDPDEVMIWLLTSDLDGRPKRERAGPARLNCEQARRFSEVLLEFDSYMWDCQKMCLPDYGARVRFQKGDEFVDCSICYECDTVEVSIDGREKTHDLSGGRVHNAFVKAIQPIFPHDRVVRDLRLYPERK